MNYKGEETSKDRIKSFTSCTIRNIGTEEIIDHSSTTQKESTLQKKLINSNELLPVHLNSIFKDRPFIFGRRSNQGSEEESMDNKASADFHHLSSNNIPETVLQLEAELERNSISDKYFKSRKLGKQKK